MRSRVVSLRRVAQVIAGQSPPSAEVTGLNNGLPFLQGNADFGATVPLPRQQCVSAPKRSMPNDLLISVRAPVGALNWSDRAYGIGRGLAAIRTASGGDRRYLAYALSAMMPNLHAESTGTTFDAVTADQLLALRIPWTDQVEQRWIANFLDDQVSGIDQAVRLRETQVELLLIRQRSMVERFLGDVGPGNPTVRLQRLMRESDERIGSAVDATELLSVSIHHGVRRRSDHTGDPARSDDLQKYKVVRANDLVLNRMRAFQGGLGIAPIKGIVSPDYAVIRLGAHVDPWFLHHLSRSSWFIGEMTARLRGIGSVDQGNVRTPRINVEDFLRIEIPSIGMNEQRSAAAAFQDAEEDVRRQVSLFESHVVLLRERKRALITATVTGDFDVTTATGRGVA